MIISINQIKEYSNNFWNNFFSKKLIKIIKEETTKTKEILENKETIKEILLNFKEEKQKEYKNIKTIEEKIIFFNNLFSEIDNLIKNSNTSLNFIRQPKLSIKKFNKLKIEEKIYNLQWKKNTIDNSISWWNCYFWNYFYYELITEITNNDNDIKITWNVEKDRHSFLSININNKIFIIDPTWIDKTRKKLNLKNNEKSHFIKNIDFEDFNKLEIIEKYYLNNEDYLDKIDEWNTISIWINFNNKKYSFIIDNKEYKDTVDIVCIINWKKQKNTIKFKNIKINNKMSLIEIFNIITRYMIVDSEDKEVILKMLNKSSKKNLIKLLQNKIKK